MLQNAGMLMSTLHVDVVFMLIEAPPLPATVPPTAAADSSVPPVSHPPSGAQLLL